MSDAHRRLVIARLAERFRAAAAEKNGTLIRYDIVEGLRRLYDQVPDKAVREAALALIASETEAKKYAGLRLEGVAPSGRLPTSKIHQTMPPQISLAAPEEVDAEVLAWLQRAYEQNR